MHVTQEWFAKYSVDADTLSHLLCSNISPKGTLSVIVKSRASVL